MASTFGTLDLTFHPDFIDLVNSISSKNLKDIELMIKNFCGYNFKQCITYGVVNENKELESWYGVHVKDAINKLMENGLLFHWAVLNWCQNGFPTDRNSTWRVKMVSTLQCSLVKNSGCLPVPIAVNVSGLPRFFLICFSQDSKDLSSQIQELITHPLVLQPADFYVLLRSHDEDSSLFSEYTKIIKRFLAWGLVQEWEERLCRERSPDSKNHSRFLLEHGDIPSVSRATSFKLTENLYLTFGDLNGMNSYSKYLYFPSFRVPFSSSSPSLMRYIWLCVNLIEKDVAIDEPIGKETPQMTRPLIQSEPGEETPQMTQPLIQMTQPLIQMTQPLIQMTQPLIQMTQPLIQMTRPLIQSELGNVESECVFSRLERCFASVNAPGCDYDVRKDSVWKVMCFDQAVAAADVTKCVDTFMSQVYVALLKNFTTCTAQSVMKDLVVNIFERSSKASGSEATDNQHANSSRSRAVIYNICTESVRSEASSGNYQSLVLPAPEMCVSAESTESASRSDSFDLQERSYAPLSNFSIGDFQLMAPDENQTQLVQNISDPQLQRLEDLFLSASNYPPNSTCLLVPANYSEDIEQSSADCQPQTILDLSNSFRQSHSMASHGRMDSGLDIVTKSHQRGVNFKSFNSSEQQRPHTTISARTVVSTVESRRTVVTTVDHKKNTVVTTVNHEQQQQQTEIDSINLALTARNIPGKVAQVRSNKRKKEKVEDEKSRKKSESKIIFLTRKEIQDDDRKEKISKKTKKSYKKVRRKQTLTSLCDQDNIGRQQVRKKEILTPPCGYEATTSKEVTVRAGSLRSTGRLDKEEDNSNQSCEVPVGSQISDLCLKIPPEWCLPEGKTGEDTAETSSDNGSHEVRGDSQYPLRKSEPFGKPIPELKLKIPPEWCTMEGKARADTVEGISDRRDHQVKGDSCCPVRERKPAEKLIFASLSPPKLGRPEGTRNKGKSDNKSHESGGDVQSPLLESKVTERVKCNFSKNLPEWCRPDDNSEEDKRTGTTLDSGSPESGEGSQCPLRESEISEKAKLNFSWKSQAESSHEDELDNDGHVVREDSQCSSPESMPPSKPPLRTSKEYFSADNKNENLEQSVVKVKSSLSAIPLGKSYRPHTENSSSNNSADVSVKENERIVAAGSQVVPPSVGRGNVSSDDEIMEVVEVNIKKKIWKRKSNVPMVDKACQTDSLIIDIDED